MDILNSIVDLLDYSVLLLQDYNSDASFGILHIAIQAPFIVLEFIYLQSYETVQQWFL